MKPIPNTSTSEGVVDHYNIGSSIGEDIGIDIGLKLQIDNKSHKALSKTLPIKKNNDSFSIDIMAFPVVEFSREGFKIRKVFG